MTRREDGANSGNDAAPDPGIGSRSNETNSSPGALPPAIFPPADTAPSLLPDQQHRNHAATGASAASVRALTMQLVAFYFRAPAKAFFRTRVDYLAYARALHEQQKQQQQQQQQSSQKPPGLPSGTHHNHQHQKSWSPFLRLGPFWQWLQTSARGTAPGVLATAVRHYGWRVVPDQVLPPLVANVCVGAVLYTSYLQIVARLHRSHLGNPPSDESSSGIGGGISSSRPWPPPGPAETFTAGFLAGALQSVVAAPLDAVQARYDLGTAAGGMTGSGNPAKAAAAAAAAASKDAANGIPGIGATAAAAAERHQSMWAFSRAKLREIGVRGIFAGWGLSFLKDSFGSAIFFSVFELAKAQAYYGFVTWYYGSLDHGTVRRLAIPPSSSSSSSSWVRSDDGFAHVPTIRPHYAIEPAFLLLAGTSASVAQQVVLHPLSHLQVEHWERLEMLDAQARKIKRDVEAAKSASASPGHLSQPPAPTPKSRWRFRMFRAYYHAYQETWAVCQAEAAAAGLSMRRWLFRGFWWNTVRQVPSTSAGLIIFELVRRKYGMGDDDVRINRGGYDILLD